MKTILLTGITGVVGGELAWKFLWEGCRVVAIVRSKKSVSPQQRLSELGFGEWLRNGQLLVCEGDLCFLQDQDSFPKQAIVALAGQVDEVVHAAADTRLDEKKASEVRRTNLEGTENLLTLAEMLGVPKVSFISTMYVAGSGDSLGEQGVYQGTPRNPYEASKREAETRVLSYSDDSSIIRIPIIVGDSKTGHILNIQNGYYGFFLAIWEIRNLAIKALQERPEDCETSKIERIGEGELVIPLHVPSSLKPLNLLPIDCMTENIWSILNLPKGSGKVFHVINLHPPTVQHTIETSLDIMKIRGMHVSELPNGEIKGVLGKALQKILYRMLVVYRPYTLMFNVKFSASQTIQAFQAVGKPYAQPPEFDRTIFETLLHPALTRNFDRSTA